MLGRRVLLCSCDRVGARRLAVALRAAGNDVVLAGSGAAATALIGARAIDLALIDDSVTGALEAIDAAAAGGIPAVAMSARSHAAAMLDFLCDRQLHHVLARSGEDVNGLREVDAREVVITVEKILRGDIFGLDKYLPGFGVERCEHEVRSAAARDDVVASVRDYVLALGAGRELSAALAVVADELITNAVYNAPRDNAGQPRYASRSRRDKIELDPWEHVRVEFGSDGERFALSVTDWFGALAPERIREGLRRCLTEADQIEQKDGGAGIGLFSVLNSCSQLVFNVVAGVRTEVIAVADMSRRMRGMRRSGQSMHLFFQPAPAPVEVSDGVPGSIQISESMRVDLCSTLGRLAGAPGIVPLTRSTLAQRPAAEPAAVPSGRLGSDDEPLGIDTACGLVRGARTAEAAIGAALRHLATGFAGAIAYRPEGGDLIPVRAVGRARDWARVREERVPLDESSALARYSASHTTAVYRAGLDTLDARVAEMVSRLGEATCLVLPVVCGGELRAVLFACAPRQPGTPVPEGYQRLRRELEYALGRLDEGGSAYASIELG